MCVSCLPLSLSTYLCIYRFDILFLPIITHQVHFSPIYTRRNKFCTDSCPYGSPSPFFVSYFGKLLCVCLDWNTVVIGRGDTKHKSHNWEEVRTVPRDSTPIVSHTHTHTHLPLTNISSLINYHLLRCSERLRPKAGGGESLTHTLRRWIGGMGLHFFYAFPGENN